MSKCCTLQKIKAKLPYETLTTTKEVFAHLQQYENMSDTNDNEDGTEDVKKNNKKKKTK